MKKKTKKSTQSSQQLAIARVAHRKPFRPFSFTLTSGEEFFVRRPENFGAPGDLRLLYFFDEHDAIMIEPSQICTVSELRENDGPEEESPTTDE